MKKSLVHKSFFPFLDVALLSDTVQGEYDVVLKEKAVWPTTNPREAVAQIYKAKILYLHPDGFDYWSDILLQLQQHKPLQIKIFIIADSDYAFGNEHLDVFTAFFPTTKFWVQNWCGINDHVSLLPIGVNKTYSREIVKTKPLGISYLLNYTNNPKRREFFDFLNEHPFMLQYWMKRGSFEEYFDGLSDCMFSTCPMGEGFDTYRFWESLMMGAIPIVKKHEFYENLRLCYPKIPFIEVEEWKDIVELLPKLTHTLYNSSIKKADLSCLEESYWLDQILFEKNAEKE